jgi:hypothetical protein
VAIWDIGIIENITIVDRGREFQNKLVLNVRKCNIMSFSRKIDTLCYNYNFGGAIISRPDSIKDLGIVFDRKMTFDLHINYVITRSMSMLGFVKRFGKEFSDPYVLKSFEDYCAHVHLYALFWNMVHVFGLRISRCIGAELRVCSENF